MNTSAKQGFLAGKRVDGPVSGHIRLDGREYLNFYGTGYLVLSQVNEVRKAVADALAQNVPFSQQIPAALLGGVDPIFEAV